jgi:oxalate decarboxylase
VNFTGIALYVLSDPQRLSPWLTRS